MSAKSAKNSGLVAKNFSLTVLLPSQVLLPWFFYDGSSTLAACQGLNLLGETVL